MLTEFTTFRPATSIVQRTSGRAVLSFSKIKVKGTSCQLSAFSLLYHHVVKAER